MTQKQNTPRVAPLWRGVNFSHSKKRAMKKVSNFPFSERFSKTHLSILSVWLVLSAGALQSCNREHPAELSIPTSTGTVNVVDRSCSSGFCEFTITAVNSVTLEICGDISSSASSCNFGCNTLSDDRYDSIVMASNDQVTYCVNNTGAICIRSPATSSSSADLLVRFQGTSTPLNVTIPIGDVRCFHTNSSCGTLGGCP